MREFSSAVVVVATACVLGGCSKHTTRDDIKPISMSQLRTLIADAEAEPDRRRLLLIDPRSPAKYADGHLPTARNVQLSDVPLKPRRPEIDTFDAVVVYGEHASDAAAEGMTKRLIAADYKEPKMFLGGLMEWRAAGLPVVEETPKP